MKCPKCPGQLEPVEHGGVELDCCPVCFGLWFDKNELGKFNQFDTDFPLFPGKILPGKHTNLCCPRCSGLLKESPYGPGIDFKVERCIGCEGVWLDADEIVKVRGILEGQVKRRRKGLVQFKEAIRREQELWKLCEAETARQEEGGKPSRKEWWFMFLTTLPLEVHNPVYRFPKVTVVLVVANVLAFLTGVFVFTALDAEWFPRTYGFVPDQFRQMKHLWSLLTSMFLHSGIVHLLGNMYFLYVFGDNVEDYLGSLRFAALYFLCGIMAAVFHFSANVYSTTPLIGASGAVSGILGAYMLLFSRRKIYILISFWPVKLRALWYLGFWIEFQILASSAPTPHGEGGIAYLAHIGGFLGGVLGIAFDRGLKKIQIALHPA